VVVLVDDMGFSDLGCFGSEIDTPHLDQLAAQGLRHANFHVSPMCSPTRASLMTGRNAHVVGMGMVANYDPGFPGYSAELPEDTPTLAEILRGNGYSTLMVGKWHLAKDADLNEAGCKTSWPLQRGFEQYYGFLEAMTNYHHPHRLYEGNSAVQVDSYPEGYYLTDDLTDRAIQMVRGSKLADPAKPFFLYFAHGAPHAPLQAKAVDIDRYRDRYECGWDVIRAERLARMIDLGIMPEGTQLPPRNREDTEDVVPWDELSADEKRIFARYMECYAAMVDNIDQSMGRLREALEELGEWDNTIILFTSDNGASREGLEYGTTSYWRARSTGSEEGGVDPRDLDRIDDIGGPTTFPHYPRGWAMACNTPFRLYKITTYRGGHQVPMILSWPAGELVERHVVRRQYAHVTDVLPTLLELLDVPLPDSHNGHPSRTWTG
jgi:arylsulfatase